MATTLRQVEGEVVNSPWPPDGLSEAAQSVDPLMVWARVEGYVAFRWSPREVTWHVEGPGEWTPPLTPATVTTSQVWIDAAWEDVELQAGPMGFVLGAGIYRVVAEVGVVGPAPAGVLEAVRRLTEYFAIPEDAPGASSLRIDVADVGSQAIERSPQWLARAMQNSGAADLLRPYRRAP